MSEEAQVLWMLGGIFLLLILPILFAVARWAVKVVNRRRPSQFSGKALTAFELINSRLTGKKKEPEAVKFMGEPWHSIAILALLLGIAAWAVIIAGYIFKACTNF